MRMIRDTAIALAATLAVAALSGCGQEPGGATTTGRTDPDRAAIETVFHSYNEALLARDFGTACALNAPERNDELIRSVAAQGSQAGTCEGALGTVYTSPAAAAVADSVNHTAKVQQITVTGDTATINWTFDHQGRSEQVKSGVRRLDGQWRLLDTT